MSDSLKDLDGSESHQTIDGEPQDVEVKTTGPCEDIRSARATLPQATPEPVSTTLVAGNNEMTNSTLGYPPSSPTHNDGDTALEVPDSNSSDESADDDEDYFPYNPAEILNRLFLQRTTDDVEIAIIHDNYWINLSATDLEVLQSETTRNMAPELMDDLLPASLLPSYQVQSDQTTL